MPHKHPPTFKPVSLIRTRTLTLVLLSVVLGTAGFIWLMRPELSRLQAAAQQRHELLVQIAEIEQKKALLDKATDRLAEVQRDLTKLNTAIPQESTVGEYVAALEALAGETGTQLSTISTNFAEKTVGSSSGEQPAVQKVLATESELMSRYYSTTLELRTVGSFTSLNSFMERLLNLDRFATISALSLTAAADGNLSGSLSIRIYHEQMAS